MTISETEKSPETQHFRGYLTYLAEIENAGFYQHRVVDKVRIADSLAVAAYGIDHSQHFLNNDLIPHRC